MRYPKSVLVIGLGFGLFFLALAVMCLAYPNKTGTPAIAAFFGGFAAMGAWLVGEYFGTSFALEADGLKYRTLTGKRGVLRWADVRKASFSWEMKWFVLESTDDRTIRVSCMITGVPAFAQAVLAHVPADAIEQASRDAYDATAAGNPPSVWQQ